MNKANSSIRRRTANMPIECLRSSDYDVVEFYKNHETVSETLGLDLTATVALARALPLGLRDAEHQELRFELAKILAEGKRKLMPQLPNLVEMHFGLLDVPGIHDLLHDVCKPFVNDCMGILAGTQIENREFDNLSDIFDPAIGFSKRKRLEANTKRLLTQAIESSKTHDKNGAAFQLAVAVMGRDALLGSIAFSLHRHFVLVKDSAINARRFPMVPTDTGVPYIWRIGVAPKTEGKTYECHLGQLVGADDDERLKLFGLGAHTCLGKVHSLKIFEALSEHLSRKGRTVRMVSISQMEKHVLKIPETFEIGLE